MKRILLIVFYLFLVQSLAFAQDWNVGVKGGLNLASGSITNSSSELGSVLGFHAGGFANTPLTDQLVIQPEVQVSFQGWENLNSENISITYFAVPVVVKYYLVDQFSVHAGPQFSFLISAEDNREDILKSTDIAVSFGAEYDINEDFGAGARYNMGFLDVLDNPETSSKIRTRVFQVFVSYNLTR